MRINGIGTVSQKKVSSVLTKEALDCIKSGDMTWQEAGEMYKVQQVKKESKIGANGETFNKCYGRIPEALQDKLSPKELAELVDAFYQCYGDGKMAGRIEIDR